MKCAWCGREATGTVARPARWAAAIALGFAHAGMWADEALRKPLCARCRRTATGLALLAAAAGLSAAAAGVYLLSRTISTR